MPTAGDRASVAASMREGDHPQADSPGAALTMVADSPAPAHTAEADSLAAAHTAAGDTGDGASHEDTNHRYGKENHAQPMDRIRQGSGASMCCDRCIRD